MENVVTGFVFLSDIDFLPGVDTYTSLKKSIHAFYDVDITGNSIKPKLVGERYFYILLNTLHISYCILTTHYIQKLLWIYGSFMYSIL